MNIQRLKMMIYLFGMKNICTDRHVIVCYLQKEPVLAVVNEDNFVRVVSELCNGFEIVYCHDHGIELKKDMNLHERRR